MGFHYVTAMILEPERVHWQPLCFAVTDLETLDAT